MAIDDALDLSVALGRDDGGDAATFQVGEYGVGVVTLVAQQDLGRGPGSAITGA